MLACREGRKASAAVASLLLGAVKDDRTAWLQELLTDAHEVQWGRHRQFQVLRGALRPLSWACSCMGPHLPMRAQMWAQALKAIQDAPLRVRRVPTGGDGRFRAVSRPF